MEKVMTSINKPYSQLILDGIKKVEWRTKPLPKGKHELYETKNKGGLGKVVGNYEVVENIKVDIGLRGISYNNENYGELLELGCVDLKDLIAYSNGKGYLYANIIQNAKRYDKPKELSEFRTVDNKAVKQCEHRERVYNNPDYTNGALLLGSYVCNKYETDWCAKCKTKPITRPPQSYMFVESLGE